MSIPQNVLPIIPNPPNNRNKLTQLIKEGNSPTFANNPPVNERTVRIGPAIEIATGYDGQAVESIIPKAAADCSISTAIPRKR